MGRGQGGLRRTGEKVESYFFADCFRRSAQYFFILSPTAMRWAAVIAGRLRLRTGVAGALSVCAGRPRLTSNRRAAPPRRFWERSLDIGHLSLQFSDSCFRARSGERLHVDRHLGMIAQGMERMKLTRRAKEGRVKGH